MRSRRYAFVFPAAILLLGLTGQSVLGFSLTGPRQGSSAILASVRPVKVNLLIYTDKNELDIHICRALQEFA